jgi:hypothetical protein
MGVLLMKRERERVRVQGPFPTRSIRNTNVDTGSFVTPRVESRGYTRYHESQRQFSSVSRYHLNIEGKLIKQLCYVCLPKWLCRASATFRPRFSIPLLHQANTRLRHWGIHSSTYPSIHPPIYWITRTCINLKSVKRKPVVMIHVVTPCSFVGVYQFRSWKCWDNFPWKRWYPPTILRGNIT